MENSIDAFGASPLNAYDTERLGRALHNQARKLDILRIGDGTHIRVNGATFRFEEFMATLRAQFPDPDGE